MSTSTRVKRAKEKDDRTWLEGNGLSNWNAIQLMHDDRERSISIDLDKGHLYQLITESNHFSVSLLQFQTDLLIDSGGVDSSTIGKRLTNGKDDPIVVVSP